MKKLFNIQLFFVLCLYSCSTSTNRVKEDSAIVEEVLSLLYYQDVYGADSLVKSIPNSLIKDALQSQVDYFIDGYMDDQTLLPYKGKEKTAIQDFIYHLTLADILKFHNIDSLAYDYYKLAADATENLGSDILKRETYCRLTYFAAGLESQEARKKIFGEYIESYNQSIDDPKNDLNYYYLNSISQVFHLTKSSEKLPKSLSPLVAEMNFGDPYFEGRYYLMKGLTENLIHRSLEQGAQSEKIALEKFRSSDLGISMHEEATMLVNQSASAHFKKNYLVSIEKLNEALGVMGHSKSEYPKKMFTYELLSENYRNLGNQEEYMKYSTKLQKVKDSIKGYEALNQIIEKKHSLELLALENQKKELVSSKKFFQANFYLVLPLALALGVFTYFFRKQYKKTHSEKQLIQNEYQQSLKEQEYLQEDLTQISKKINALENEKIQTIERLKKLKEVVTKDFIILKDKSKVYIEELMCIQSDDHYLKVKVYNKQDNFVRGKLSSIIKDLPPNFKRCHRSFIVNDNYIAKYDPKQLTLTDGTVIPLSKSYRKNFEV